MKEPSPVFPFQALTASCEHRAHQGCRHFSFRVSPSLPWFPGHFPGAPILPGFAILEITQELMALALPERASLITRVRQAEFSQPVLPGMDLRLEVHGLGPPDWQVEWRAGDGRAVAKIIFEVASRRIISLP